MSIQASILREFDRRRSEPRQRISLPVFVETGKSLFEGEMLNISRGGALLQVSEDAFDPGPGEGPQTEAYAERVRAALKDGVGVHLFHGVLRMTAEVVRVSGGSREGFLLLGCRFLRPPDFGAWHLSAAGPEEAGSAPPPTV